MTNMNNVSFSNSSIERVGSNIQCGLSEEQPLRIMVVDDNVDSADVLGVFFASNGHEVKVEYCGQSALTTVEHYSPHIVIIDIGLPDLDGRTLLTKLQTHFALESTVFVAFSGYSDPDSKAGALRAGFHHYIIKPSCISVFFEIIDDYQKNHLKPMLPK
jgi:PleD family two-component response regulator